MNQRYLITAGLLSILTGCAGHPASSDFYRKVIVDTTGVNLAQYQQDLADCENYAAQVNTGSKVVTGAAGGAAIGGLLGAAIGNSQTTQKGAGAGAVTGGARGAFNSYEEKSRVVRNCMIGRGYSVLN